MAPEELEKLKAAINNKKSLKRKLITDSQYTRRYVNYVLNGDRQNEELLEMAVTIIKDDKKKKFRI